MASARSDLRSEIVHHAAGRAPPFPQTSCLRVCLGIDVGLWTAVFRRGAHDPSSGFVRMPKATLLVMRGREGNTRPVDASSVSLFSDAHSIPLPPEAAGKFQLDFDDPPETAATRAAAFVSFGISTARAEPRRAGRVGEVLRDEPAVIPFGIDGDFHDAAPHRRHGAGASKKTRNAR